MSIKKAFAAILASATMVTGLAIPANAAMPLPVPAIERPAELAPHNVDVRIGFSVSNGRGIYNGHRGFRNYRPGYRVYNGFWFPYSAFMIEPRRTYRYVDRVRPVRMSAAHVEWCFDRYRSYRTYDNSWQPYNGPRRVCRSPYR